jgi:hypothetical protein
MGETWPLAPHNSDGAPARQTHDRGVQHGLEPCAHSLEWDKEKWKPVFRLHPAQNFGIDHDDFGLIQSKIIVI